MNKKEMPNIKKSVATLAAVFGIGLYKWEGEWFEANQHLDDPTKFDMMHVEEMPIIVNLYAEALAFYFAEAQMDIIAPTACEPIVVAGYDQPFDEDDYS